MPNKKYLELQSEFYSVTYPDTEDRTSRYYDLQDKYKCPIWITEDNNLIPIVFMSISHMRNAHAYFKKAATKAIEVFYLGNDRESGQKIKRISKRLSWLFHESKRRKMKPPLDYNADELLQAILDYEKLEMRWSSFEDYGSPWGDF